MEQTVASLPEDRRELAKQKIRCVEDARLVVHKITEMNQQLDPTYDFKTLLDTAIVVDLLAQMNISRKNIREKREEKNHQTDHSETEEREGLVVPRRFVPVEMDRVLGTAAALRSLKDKGCVDFGEGKFVDLGGGDGRWAVALALMGFSTTSIELGQILDKQAQENVKELRAGGVPIPEDKIKLLHDKFYVQPEENSPAVREALAQADVMICWPFSGEEEERIRLFLANSKPKAKLLFYEFPNKRYLKMLAEKYDLEWVNEPPESLGSFKKADGEYFGEWNGWWGMLKRK